MTTVTITIGIGVLADISANVEEVDTWRNKQNSIGQCRLLFDNPDNVYGGVFFSNDAISITIGATEVWTGFVDDVKPFLSPRGVYTNKMEVTGSDRGRYGADLYVTAKYEEQDMDEIIEKINILAGTPWTWADPGATPDVKYECRRTYLSDAVREICDLSDPGYDSYITNAGVLTIFVAGADASGVALKSIAADVTNNLLSFEEYEQVAKGIRNYIEVSAGSVKDHYTDENAVTGWTAAGAGAVVSDDTAKHIWGEGSIYLACNGAVSQAYLDFSALKYGYLTLDLSKPCQAKVFLSAERTGAVNVTVRPFMTDGGANTIRFYRKAMGSGSKGYTELVPDWTAVPTWNILTYPLGDTCTIKAAQQSGFWYGDVAFDWTDVAIIGFEYDHTDNGEVWIDGWTIPSLDAKDIVEDAGVGSSQDLYDKRMFHKYKKELKSLNQITAYATRLLALKKDPVQKFKAVAKGQEGSLYAAQTLTVQAPSHGIAGATDYIITKLHHKVRKNAISRGFDFTTTYDLVREETLASRISDNQMAEYLAALSTMMKEHGGGMMDEDILIGGVQTGTQTAVESGTPFPLDPNNGDLFDLSADLTIGAAEYYGPARYWYDETLGDWYRNPMFMQRGGDPNPGGEVLDDELYRTDLDIWYRWTGVWTQMDVAATVISGTIGATQLKKGIQPFDSSVLVEAIRVVATAAVPMSIDVNNGAGRADIIAPGLTPFSDFTAGDEIIIQSAEDTDHNTTARTVFSVNGGGLSITLDNVLVGADNTDDEMVIVSVADGLKWTGANPAVWFADGTTQNIANGSDTGLAPNTYWVIFTTGAGVTLTSTYADAVGDTVGIIARVTVVAGQEPLIFPVFTRQGSTTLDFLGAGVIDTIVLTGDALIGKIMKSSDGVSWTDGVGDPGTIMTRYGIQGKGAAGVTQFFLDSTDGRGYFGAGKAIMSATGLRLDGAIVEFWDALGAALMGNLGIYTHALTDWVTLSAVAGNNVLLFAPAGQEVMVYGGATATMWANTGDVRFVTGAAGGDIKFAPRGVDSLKVLSTGVIEPLNDIIPSAAGKDIGGPGAGDFFAEIHSADFYGQVRYSDLRSTDLTCARCGERFKKGQSLVFEVKGYEPNKVHGEEMLSLPVHAQCPIIPRVRKWVHGLLR